jgi:hypothetical protein
MEKTFKAETVQVCKVARRLGVIAEKKTLCPGCGKVKHYEALAFELRALEGRIKEVNTPKADGLEWCQDCQGGRG